MALALAPPFVDTHTHLDPDHPEESVAAALRAMPEEHATRIFFLPPPFLAGDRERHDADSILPAVKGHEDRLAVLGGGGTLNPMIQEAARSGEIGPAVRERFRERAEALLRLGVAGFGELSSEHFQGATGYQNAPPDHPLFLLLADIAAEHGVPIVLHMEAVPRPMPPPAGVKSPPAPPELRPNVEALERLLAHDRRARVVWAHAGWDSTGERSPALCRRLLAAHPNLFMDLKVDPARPGKSPLLGGGSTPTLDPRWLEIFREFPDRFVLGSDQHYPEPPGRPLLWKAVAAVLEQLPPELQRKIGSENAVRIFAQPAGRAR
jgi:predicted TIM-barrel fold metal-dependent hydrolase